MNAWQGIIPPIVTPFEENGRVDLGGFEEVCHHLVSHGVDGLFVLGSTGEAAYLTDSERNDLIRRTVQLSKGLPVFAGCIDLTARRCVERAQAAQEAGADAVVITAPIYARNSVAEIEQHFRLVASSVDIPVIAYDIPVRVHIKLQPESLVKLASDGVIRGVKDSSGDDVSFRRLISLNRKNGSPLRVFTGHEVCVDGAMLLGIDGVVPGLANVDPAAYVKLWRLGREHQWDDAVREQQRLADLFEIVFLSPELSGDAAGVGAFKEAMYQLGIIGSAKMAAPTESLSILAKQRIREILQTVGLQATA